jgi:hypothetical protein
MRDEEVFLAFITFGIFVVVPVVAMLLHHQRKMAGLIHEKHAMKQAAIDPQSDARIRQLEAEVHHLKQQVNDQIIQADSLQDHRLEDRVQY